jgi:PKD repeat protein
MRTPSPVPRSLRLTLALTVLLLAPLAVAHADGTARRIIDSNDGLNGTAPLRKIYVPPLARLVLTKPPAPPLTVIADASGSQDTSGVGIESYHFDFGDSTPVVINSAPVVTAQHTYSAPGYYTVILTVTDNGQHASSTTSVGIDVELPDFPPVAALTLTQLPSPPLTVSADASGSTDTDVTPIASFQFDFGDTTPVVITTAPAATAEHTYATAGHHTVTVIVTDTGNQASSPLSAGIDVALPDFPPVAALSVTQLATPALTVRADASGSTDTDVTPIASYQFDFGDATPVVTTTAPTATAQHTYATAGHHIVTVIVTDTGNRASGPLSAGIDVAPPDFPPVAVLAVTQLASPPLTVMADASGSTDTDITPIGVYQYDFGDGTPEVITTAPIDSVVHTYAAPGTYTVTLTAVDTGDQDSSPAIVHINVLAPDFPPVAMLSVTQLVSAAYTVSADASASADTDATPIASYHFNFGDGTPEVVTTAPTATAQHVYATAGHYIVTLIAIDTGGHSSSPATAGIDVAAPIVLDARVAASSDDAEEFSDATVHLTSSDLELIHDTSDQIVGMRWAGLNIPAGAIVTSAYIQFSSKEQQNAATQLTLRAQAADNATTFTTSNGNVSTRPRTVAAASWAPVAWNIGDAGANQRTPDLSALIQEVVGRSGWSAGHALAVIVNGTGHRTAWAYDGSPTSAPLLHVEYMPAPIVEQPPVARLTVAQVASPALTVYADASGSTDVDTTPIASYRFNFGDGSPVVITTAPTATALHTYAAPGNYTVALTATDTGNLTSPLVTDTVSVNVVPPPQIAIYAGYYDTHHAVNPQPKPDPWRGSPNTVFVGQPDNQPGDPPTGGWDSSCMRVDNLTSSTLNNVVVTVDVGTHHYALWGTNSIPPGYHLVMAQTVYENFDVPDVYPAGCYGCDTSLCLTARSSEVPLIHVSIGSATADYPDTGQTINTDGYDAAGCPYVGGPLPQTRYDESRQWVRIWPAVGGGLHAVPVVPGGASAAPATDANAAPIARAIPRVLSLSPPSPNPAHGEASVRFTTPRNGPVHVGLYDISGRLVRPVIDSELASGEYTFRLELGRVPPGIYFLRLWTPAASRIEKLVRLN